MSIATMLRRGLVTLLLALAVGGGSTMVAASAPASPEEQFTPVVMSVMSKPSWFRGSDGDVHLAYELQMLNAFPVGVTIESVDVRNADTHQSVITLTGDDLLASMSLLPIGDAPTTHLTPSQTGAVWFDIRLPNALHLPRRIEHVVNVDVEPGLPVPDTIVEEGARSKVDLGPPIVISAPLHGKRWLALGSCCDGPHRRSAQPVNGKIWLAQRFAIDYNRLYQDNFLVHGDPSLNESWATYGQPVYASATTRSRPRSRSRPTTPVRSAGPCRPARISSTTVTNTAAPT